MSLLRKTLKAAAITFGLLTVVCSLLWYKFSDNISPDMWRHAEYVWHGYTPITGDRTPGEMIRYAKRRLEGHPNLEAIALPSLHWAQTRVERPVPVGPLPTLGKGQQPTSLAPIDSQRPTVTAYARNTEELVTAINTAHAGQTILIAPGIYRINKKIKTGFSGTPLQSITVRADQPGQVIIEFNAEEGFFVSHAYWIFENLQIQGVCKSDKDCEHAFHIVGQAHHVIVRNNVIKDFNAHVKINGFSGDWPDHGLIKNNTLTNSLPRNTYVPITPIDLVGASNWQVEDNIISNFIKNDGDKISYGVFMKGGGRDGRIERNLIICTPTDISQPGVRVGLSFGGGTTEFIYCRDKKCATEHTGGLAANNIIAHCNDFGIDINKSKEILIAHNTLINTAGIDVRQEPASATLYGNLLEGQARRRNGAKSVLQMNETRPMEKLLINADKLQLSWLDNPEKIPSIMTVPSDFYGKNRADGTFPGAIAPLH